MRDPLNWSLPLFRAFGIQVRLHVLYIIITLGLVYRTITRTPNHWVEFTVVFVGLLFVIVLLHEFGHCFAARRVDGDAEQILMWPLGGLAFCEVPHTPRAHFVTAAGGPLVNVALCLACAAALVPAGYVPPLNVFDSTQVVAPDLSNWQDGTTTTAAGWDRYRNKENGELFLPGGGVLISTGELAMYDPVKEKVVLAENARLPAHPAWVTWAARVFWLSWLLLLFNLVPAFPLDGGRLLQAVVWGRTQDHRRATQTACYTGVFFALLFALVGIANGEPMMMALSIFMGMACYQQLLMLDAGLEDRGPFGYDFSQGYTSLEGEDEEEHEPKPRPPEKKPGAVGRWLKRGGSGGSGATRSGRRPTPPGSTSCSRRSAAKARTP